MRNRSIRRSEDNDLKLHRQLLSSRAVEDECATSGCIEGKKKQTAKLDHTAGKVGWYRTNLKAGEIPS